MLDAIIGEATTRWKKLRLTAGAAGMILLPSEAFRITNMINMRHKIQDVE